MPEHNNSPKPDDRSDNAEKLQSMIQDTAQNMKKANETIEFSSGEGKQQIQAKNKRREEAIQGMREEIKDEYKHQNDMD